METERYKVVTGQVAYYETPEDKLARETEFDSLAEAMECLAEEDEDAELFILVREAEVAWWKKIEPVACSDCPPVGYPTDKTRCNFCPRREAN